MTVAPKTRIFSECLWKYQSDRLGLVGKVAYSPAVLPPLKLAIGMPTDPIIISTAVAAGLYILAWIAVPAQKRRCERCESKMKRVPRLRWQRVLSVAIPLCNMRCEYCGNRATRRRSLRS